MASRRCAIALSRNSARCSSAERSATISRKPPKIVAKPAHRLSTGKLLANIARAAPKRSITVRTMSRLAATVHGCARLAEAGDLDRHVRAGGERGHRALPPGDAVARPVGGQPGVVEDDLRVRKIGGEARGLGEVPPRRLQVETQADCGASRAKPARHFASAMPPGRRIARRRGSRAACGARCARSRTPPAAPAPAARRRGRARPAPRRPSAARARGAATRCSASRRRDRADPTRPRRRRSSRRRTAPRRPGSRAGR